MKISHTSHYIFCKINSDQIKIVHFRPKIRNVQHVNTDLLGVCATRLIPAYYQYLSSNMNTYLQLHYWDVGSNLDC